MRIFCIRMCVCMCVLATHFLHSSAALRLPNKCKCAKYPYQFSTITINPPFSKSPCGFRAFLRIWARPNVCMYMCRIANKKRNKCNNNLYLEFIYIYMKLTEIFACNKQQQQAHLQFTATKQITSHINNFKQQAHKRIVTHRYMHMYIYIYANIFAWKCQYCWGIVAMWVTVELSETFQTNEPTKERSVKRRRGRRKNKTKIINSNVKLQLLTNK